MSEKLNQLKTMIATSQENLKKMQAEMPEDDRMNKMMKEMYRYMDYVMGYIYEMEASGYKQWERHNVGHIPSVKGAGKMQAVLEALGLDDDYEVYKPMISVAKTKRGMEIEASYTKK